MLIRIAPKNSSRKHENFKTRKINNFVLSLFRVFVFILISIKKLKIIICGTNPEIKGGGKECQIWMI